ncbi:MAG: hypothetical protein Q4E88_05860 [Coriobacteriia bacterium]|nr:hypothetical protein [Coriobacteriia bacterium]
MLENFGAKPKVDSDLDSVWKNPDLTEDNLVNASVKSAKEEESKIKQEGKTVVDFTEKKPRKKFPLFKFILGALIICLIALIAFGVWNRWLKSNDREDIVSNWKIENTNTSINIDKKKIYLGPNATCDYELDTFAKVIYIKTGSMQGTCHYRFSWDRCQLAFVEDGGDNAIATIFSDLKWGWDSLTCSMNGVNLSPAYTKNSDVDTSNTGIDDILDSATQKSILLDKLATKKPDE